MPQYPLYDSKYAVCKSEMLTLCIAEGTKEAITITTYDVGCLSGTSGPPAIYTCTSIGKLQIMAHQILTFYRLQEQVWYHTRGCVGERHTTSELVMHVFFAGGRTCLTMLQSDFFPFLFILCCLGERGVGIAVFADVFGEQIQWMAQCIEEDLGSMFLETWDTHHNTLWQLGEDFQSCLTRDNATYAMP